MTNRCFELRRGEASSGDETKVSTVKKISRYLNRMAENDVLHSSSALELSEGGNAKVRISRNENIHRVKEEAITKIGGTGKLRGNSRHIAEIPKSKKERR